MKSERRQKNASNYAMQDACGRARVFERIIYIMRGKVKSPRTITRSTFNWHWNHCSLDRGTYHFLIGDRCILRWNRRLLNDDRGRMFGRKHLPVVLRRGDDSGHKNTLSMTCWRHHWINTVLNYAIKNPYTHMNTTIDQASGTIMRTTYVYLPVRRHSGVRIESGGRCWTMWRWRMANGRGHRFRIDGRHHGACGGAVHTTAQWTNFIELV